MRTDNRAGFTLIELIAVVLIIGALLAVGVPQYLKGLETSKADNAVAIVKMVSANARMFAQDHNGTYATNGTITNACNSGACSTSGWVACDLVRCNYLTRQDWDNLPYTVEAAANGACGTTGYGGNLTACVKRKTGSNPGTNIAPYNAWGYSVDVNGVITLQGAAPAATGL